MHVAKVVVTNYKSFRHSGEVKLAADFNAIVGKNNAGKTAFVEALGLRFRETPHRSSTTMPNVGDKAPEGSRCLLWLRLAASDIGRIAGGRGVVRVPAEEADLADSGKRAADVLNGFAAYGGDV